MGQKGQNVHIDTFLQEEKQMIKYNKKQRQLCEMLGNKASVTIIDGASCVRYDCGHKFDIEIVGTHKTTPKLDAFLWHDERICVAREFDINFDDIKKKVHKFENLTNEIISNGPIDEDVLYAM